MGNHRLKLANMMPNAWFYKLKEMNIPSSTNRISHSLNQNQQQKQLPPPYIPSRASYYFSSDSPLHPKALDTHFPLDSPRKFHQKPRKHPTVLSPRIKSSSESCHSDQSSSCCKITSLPNDIILEVASVLKLPPIITRSPKKEGKKKVRVVKLNKQRIPGISESFAVVKNSSNPKKDFRESMVEMIMENKLKATKDLEELLACYLSLNSSEYHDVIVKVFEEIWFDIVRV